MTKQDGRLMGRVSALSEVTRAHLLNLRTTHTHTATADALNSECLTKATGTPVNRERGLQGAEAAGSSRY